MVATSGHNRNSPKKTKTGRKKKKKKKKKKEPGYSEKIGGKGRRGHFGRPGKPEEPEEMEEPMGNDGEPMGKLHIPLPLTSAARDLFFVSVARGGQNPKREKQKIGERKGRGGRQTRQVPATAIYEVTESIL